MGSTQDEFTDVIAEQVTENQYSAASQLMNQQIEQRVALHNVNFGQTEIVPTDEQIDDDAQYQMDTVRCFALIVTLLTMILIIAVISQRVQSLGTKDFLTSDALTFVVPNESYQDLTIKEQNGYFSINKNNLGVNINSEIIAPMTYDEPNVNIMQHKRPAAKVIDDLSCTLYDMFEYVFNNLVCWKDNIMAKIPIELPDDMFSISDNSLKSIIDSESHWNDNEKTDAMLPNGVEDKEQEGDIASLIEDDGETIKVVVLSTNADISVDKIPIDLSE